MRNRRSTLLALVLTLAFVGGFAPIHARAADTVWRYNVYRSSGYLTQDPYYTACTAAAAMMMLNFTALADTGGNGFTWRSSRTKNSATNPRDMMSIYSFERSHDTLASGRPGSDAHGWRNALNYYGWGLAAMKDPDQRVYEDRAYGSFDTALKAAVRAIARFHKPVGMLGWAGGHAQVITGYVVSGEDPAVSTSFTVQRIYLSDPLQSDGIVNAYISAVSLRTGSLRYRFQAYRETDSPYDDPYTSGWKRSSIASWTSEWYHRYVLVLPIRDGLPEVTPPPDPTPTPTPTPDPTPSPTPDPAAPAEATPSPATGLNAQPTESPAATPSAPASDAPSSSPSQTPTSAPTEPSSAPTDTPALAAPSTEG